jgi:hypothetical protein
MTLLPQRRRSRSSGTTEGRQPRCRRRPSGLFRLFRRCETGATRVSRSSAKRDRRDKGPLGRASATSGRCRCLSIISVLGPFLDLPSGFTPKLGSQARRRPARTASAAVDGTGSGPTPLGTCPRSRQVPSVSPGVNGGCGRRQHGAGEGAREGSSKGGRKLGPRPAGPTRRGERRGRHVAVSPTPVPRPHAELSTDAMSPIRGGAEWRKYCRPDLTKGWGWTSSGYSTNDPGSGCSGSLTPGVLVTVSLVGLSARTPSGLLHERHQSEHDHPRD